MPHLAQCVDCTGCMACYNSCSHNAIEIVNDKEGFLQLVVKEDKCVECKLCENSCPVMTPLELRNSSPLVYAAWHKEDRCVSSSGGAFSAFAKMVLTQGGIVVGAAFDRDLHLKHIAIDSVEGLASLRGSKYVQSEIGDTLKIIRQYLNDGKKVLFCGTPCQVAGLRGFLKKDFENLLTADLVCHGVPSDSVFQNYLKKLNNRLGINKRKERIEKNEFRKCNGWDITPSIVFANKKRYLYNVDALYMEAFDKGATFRESCYLCRFATIPRVGDVTLGDFWGIGRHGNRFKHNVTKGVSLILVNSEKGRKALSAIGEDMFLEERPLQEALIENGNLKVASKRHPLRNEIIKAFLDDQMSLDDIEQRYHLVDRSLKSYVKMLAQEMGLLEEIKYYYNWYKSL